uniref:Putative secreted protein n=1 Tax=Amblyomma triste TaxID=251400 RepID=A0A023G2B4_AMBTT
MSEARRLFAVAWCVVGLLRDGRDDAHDLQPAHPLARRGGRVGGQSQRGCFLMVSRTISRRSCVSDLCRSGQMLKGLLLDSPFTSGSMPFRINRCLIHKIPFNCMFPGHSKEENSLRTMNSPHQNFVTI